MVGRSRFPSAPNLKKYSAAVDRAGISVKTLRRNRSDTLSNSACTRAKGSNDGARPHSCDTGTANQAQRIDAMNKPLETQQTGCKLDGLCIKDHR